jgi:hypothetical protein
MSVKIKWGGWRDTEPSAATVTPEKPVEPTAASKVLPKALATLANVPSPVIVDLGPVVGSNIAFLGEQLSCKIFVEDLYAEIERHSQKGTRDQLAQALPARLQQHAPGSIDGIFCWDLFDHLDKPSSQVLAAHLVSLLKPGGVIYAFFGATPGQLTQQNRFIIDAADTLRLRSAPVTPTPRNVLVTRDINRMFEGVATAESVLLKSNARETLFRKPS